MGSFWRRMWFNIACLAMGLVASKLFALRLVSLSPQVTELIFQLERGEDVIATTQFSDYPERARQIPRIGTLFAFTLETLVVLHPDWFVIDKQTVSTRVMSDLDRIQAKQFVFDVQTLEGLFEQSSLFLASVYGEKVEVRLQRWRRCLEGMTVPKNKRLFVVVVSLSPVVVVSPKAFLSNVIERITGQENIISDKSLPPYPQISLEWLASKKLDMFYFLSYSPTDGERVQKFIEKLWKITKPEMRGLEASNFSRASFTPLLKSEALNGKSLPGECYGIKP